jgi:YD repeat-containing protein
MSFDVRGRLAQSVAPNGDATTFDYDPVGWLRSVTDPSGNAIAQAKTAIRMVLPKPETIQPKYGSFSRMGQFQL